MGIEYYMFAIFVFVLVVIVAFIVIKGLQKNKAKLTVEMEKKEKKIMIMYTEVEEFLEGVEEYIIKSKEEITALRNAASKDLIDIKRLGSTLIEQMDNMKNLKPVVTKTQNALNMSAEGEIEIIEETMENKKMEISDGYSEAKRTKRILAMDMQRKGFPVEKIAEELKVSKGEVMFMLSLKFQNLNNMAD